jgi:hypothetical protein
MVIRRLAAPNLATFEEDLRSAWVPDLLGGIDAEGRVNLPPEPQQEGALEWLLVPKPDGTRLRAPLLSLPWLAALNRAVDVLKEAADGALAPSVCGYRRGAQPGTAYSREHRRFSEFARAEATGAAVVVSADVRRFFAATSWATVLAACERVVPTVSTADLAVLAEHFNRTGLTHLPAGYADARFLANVVLADADKAIELPFARWVDDYRIFAPSIDAAQDALTRLGTALETAGLMLNQDKVTLQSADDFLATCGSAFTSVYHPELEGPDTVRAALRSLFLEAAPDPVRHRRSIRFVLPRLANEQDDIAVDWALAVLRDLPWESPRIVAYLARFADREVVRTGANRLLEEALRAGETWLAIRLAGLVCVTGVGGQTTEITAGLAATQSPTLWGFLLRALALAQRRDEVRDELQRRVFDERAALAACIDAGLPTPHVETAAGAEAQRCLRGESAPLPALDSIL